MKPVDRDTRLPSSPTKTILSCLIAGCLSTPGFIAAQEAGESVLEEVIVTAQKRGEERLIDVPISISVLGKQDLEDFGIQNLGDLSYVVPGLSSFESAGTPGQQRITMRGIGADSGINSTVGYYWDEIPAASIGISPEGTTLDLNRIEVLRGPQGTLFGEGSMGGTLRFISNEPDLAAFGGEFIGGYSTVDSGGDGWNGTAVLNAPVVKDAFGLRIAGEVREEPGYIDNIQLGTRNINDRKLKQLRARARWQASENVTVDATYYHYDNEAGAPNLVDDLETLTVSTYADVEPYSEVDAFNATINADLGFATLVSATSYSDRLQSQPSASGDGVNSLIFVDAEIGGDDFTQELRLHSNNDGPLQWTAGAYYTSTEGDQPIHISVISVIPGGGALLGIPGTDLKVAADSVNSITNDVSSWALFGEVSYDFTERLTATFGARYYQSEYDWTNDSINTVTTSVLLNGLPLFEFPSVTQESNAPSGDDDSFSPRFNLSYAFAEDTMGYFNVAKGFRAGGVNLILNVPVPGGGFVQLPENYDPETLWTYEVGAKSLLDDGRWMLEGAAYYTDWTDLQAIFLPFEGASIGGTKNQGAATVYGAEVAASFLPVPTVALSGNIAYADATFDDATADHDKGDPVPYVPEFTFTAAMDWRPDFGGGIKGLVHIDYSYQDEINRINNSGVYKISTSDSFNFLNLRLGIEKDSWGAYLVGRNLTDDQGAANPVSPEQTTTFVPVRPRMLGAEFRIRF